LACRYGGEEFVIVLPGCPINEASIVLDRVRQRLADRLASGQLPTFTISFGLACSDQTHDFDGVVNMADDALLQAKAGGRDRIVVASDNPPDPTPVPPYDDDSQPQTQLAATSKPDRANAVAVFATTKHPGATGGESLRIL
jgi:hypothetical protein